MPDQIPEFAPGAVYEGQTNLLVAGKNGSLVDTLIIANINFQKRTITLVSLPRDLYYNNRKINSYYHFYGMDELKRILSNITGYKIDNYILIDMYAFIDVIDIIGGIDVHLNEPLIDPSYKVEDNGVWSTLYYRAGDHHFSGKEALRVARSRHTTSDFSRSARQQLILRSLKKKAKDLNTGDADKFTGIVKTLMTKVETDISLDQLLVSYFRYQSFAIKSGNVLSTGNILTSTHKGEDERKKCLDNIERIAELSPEDKSTKTAECQKIAKGEYILEPRNDDWNTVRWYFHQVIEGTE